MLTSLLKNPFAIRLCLLSALAYPPVAFAAPSVGGEAVFEFQLESGQRSDNPGDERTNIFGRTEVAPTVTINDHFYVDGVGVLEPILAPPPGEDAFMESEGAFIEELKLNYVNGPYHIFVGKFNPGFGIAWDYGRGVWGEDFAQDYEMTEKLGAGASATFGSDDVGQHTVTGTSFVADTSFLSESAITSRGRTRRADGGASNSDDFSSFTLSLDGDQAAGVENFSYHLGYRHVAAGDVNVGASDENGVAVNVNYTVPLTKRIQSDILLEFAGIDSVDGSPDDARYYTASVINKIDERWNVTLAYTKRDVRVRGAQDSRDHLFQATGGYDFGNGLTVEGGWKQTEEAGVDNNVVGGLARYTKSF
ncbi:MAG: hypothetical protein ABW189_03300 [Rickettsiales bacterium]